MNLFRFLGDLSHLLAIILLLLKIWKSRSCAGISGKSQVLFAVVFTARYLDLFTNYISLYNTCMKVVYIACSFTTVWMIYSKFKATYDGNHDTFRVEFLVVPTAILAFLVNHDFTPLEKREVTCAKYWRRLCVWLRAGHSKCAIIPSDPSATPGSSRPHPHFLED
uniref:KDEL endoplasmic reticulum protein retention receptor 1 n=1 Tax=Equus asinus TaxID=9793 RepID=A0A8C4L937_EQUAS